MSFNLSSMERGELCQGRCTVLPLAECMQDIGAAKPNARGAMCMDISPRFSDFGRLTCGAWRSEWTQTILLRLFL
jgi:hypothetical protein